MDNQENDVPHQGESRERTPPSTGGTKVKVVVNRRAPINPLDKLAVLKGLRKAESKPVVVAKDPMLENNPLTGRLWVTLILNSAIFFVFLSELVFNKVSFNGRCISKVLYPKLERGTKSALQPYVVELGYGACEYNLRADPFHSVFFGSDASDDGWPKEQVHTPSYAYAAGRASSQSPNERVFAILGGLNTNLMRNYNEVFRLFWSMFMHGDWYHITFNLFCQIQALWIIEPDWGFWRTLLLFFISGIGGNLISASLDPCGTTVGSSGAMYGLYGAMIPYCIEYWNTIPRPFFLMCYNLVTLIVGLVLGLTSHIDNYAHLGGCAFGMLWGFATIKSVSSCDKCTLVERTLLCPLWSWAIPKRTKAKLHLAMAFKKDRGDRKRELFQAKKLALASGVSESRVASIKKRFARNGSPPCRMRLREWFIRITAAVTLLVLTTIAAVFVFKPEVYTRFSPPGQYKFSGWQTCSCCFVQNMGKLFKEAHVPDRYKNQPMFWCFNSIKHAKVYCGSDYETRATEDLLNLSRETAEEFLNNAI